MIEQRETKPLKERGLINASEDPRTNGTRQLYFAQQWGRNAIISRLC